MKKKSWLLTLLTIFMVITTACGGGGGSESAGGEVSLDDVEAASMDMKNDTTPVKIQYWHAHADAQLEGLNYMIAEFQKKYP
ncbi:ABC transporter substrate-binding protein, partial [Burkholderia multivorans]